MCSVVGLRGLTSKYIHLSVTQRTLIFSDLFCQFLKELLLNILQYCRFVCVFLMIAFHVGIPVACSPQNMESSFSQTQSQSIIFILLSYLQYHGLF